MPDCAIERPGIGVINEQATEADRILQGQSPLLPETYEWLKRVDRDINLFGDAD